MKVFQIQAECRIMARRTMAASIVGSVLHTERPNALRLTQKAFVGIVHYMVNYNERRLDRTFAGAMGGASMGWTKPIPVLTSSYDRLAKSQTGSMSSHAKRAQ